MRLAIVGSRGWANEAAVKELVEQQPQGTVIVSGGARGVDTMATDAAKAANLGVIVFPADWERHGKMAGMIRNGQIVDCCDQLVAFWDGKSRGTADSINKARADGKLWKVIRE